MWLLSKPLERLLFGVRLFSGGNSGQSSARNHSTDATGGVNDTFVDGRSRRPKRSVIQSVKIWPVRRYSMPVILRSILA
jgi:hypothetical protein